MNAAATPRTPTEPTAPHEVAADLRRLTEANLQDLYRAFRVPPSLRGPAALLLEGFAEGFARELAYTDARVGAVGLQAAMWETLARFGVHLEVMGAEHLPTHGPLLITANHPGLTDAPALLASLPRPDLRILSGARELLEALPHLHAHLIPIDPKHPERSVRGAVRHLRAGGAVLTFPAGQIEPDPALQRAAAAASLRTWSPSVTRLARLEPRTKVVPASASGVVTPATLRHPLTLLHRAPEDKAWLAACLQVMDRRYQRNRVAVRYGPPLSLNAASGALPDAGEALFGAVLGEMARLLSGAPSVVPG